MNMTRTTGKRRGGWLLTEAILSVVLLGMLTGVVVSIQWQAGRFNHHQLTTQRCLAAGEATLESISATGKPIPEEDLRRLWPGVNLKLRRWPGTGDWEGMTLVTVVATARSHQHEVAVELARYLPAGGAADAEQ